MHAVPLQARALARFDVLERERSGPLLFPSSEGGYFDLHDFPQPLLAAGAVRRRHRAAAAGSTISGIPSRPLRSVPASPPSISPAT